MERRLAAVMIADVSGYGLHSQADEEGTRGRFQADLHELFEPRVAAHGGRLIKTMGDGLLVDPSVLQTPDWGVWLSVSHPGGQNVEITPVFLRIVPANARVGRLPL